MGAVKSDKLLVQADDFPIVVDFQLCVDFDPAMAAVAGDIADFMFGKRWAARHISTKRRALPLDRADR